MDDEVASAESNFAEVLFRIEKQIESLLENFGPTPVPSGFLQSLFWLKLPSQFLTSIRKLRVIDREEIMRLLANGFAASLHADVNLFAEYIEQEGLPRKYPVEIASGRLMAYVVQLRAIQAASIHDAPFSRACQSLSTAYKRSWTRTDSLAAATLSQQSKALECLARIPARAWMPFANGFAPVRELCLLPELNRVPEHTSS